MPVTMTKPNNPAPINIKRDAWGIPHIVADTERGAIFGQGYVQAVDRLPSVYYTYRMALGQLSEVLDDDWSAWDEWDAFMRQSGHATIARREFAKLSSEEQALLQAFIDGIQHAIAQNPHLAADERVSAWQLPQLEAWYPLAVARAVTYPYIVQQVWGEIGQEPPAPGPRPLLSTLWAVRPQRTAAGQTILSGDPHAFHSPDWLLHECGLEGGGLDVYGFQHPGMPYIRFGHNRRVAWGFTSNAGNAARPIERPPVNPTRFSPFDEAWAIATGYDGLLFDHITPLRALNQAATVGDVERILAQQQIGPWHIIAADADGDIFYQATGRIPRRDRSATGGDVYLPAELPTLHNPPDGFLCNANGSPSTVTPNAPFADLPDHLRYTVRPRFADENSPRGRQLLHRLSALERMTIDEALALVMDDDMPEGRLWRDALLAIARSAPDGPAADDPSLLVALAGWDGRAAGAGVAARWLDDFLAVMEEDDPTTKDEIWAALLAGRALSDEQVGSIHEMIAATPSADEIEPVVLARGPFRHAVRASDQLSIRVLGSVQASPTRYDGRRGLAADYGQVAPVVVAFGPDGVRSWAVVPYGQSDFPSSPHYADQMALFASGHLRETSFAKPPQWATIIPIGLQ